MSGKETVGFITRYGRCFHTTVACRKYRFGIKGAARRGYVIHPPVTATAAQALATGRTPCRAC